MKNTIKIVIMILKIQMIMTKGDDMVADQNNDKDIMTIKRTIIIMIMNIIMIMMYWIIMLTILMVTTIFIMTTFLTVILMI